MIVLFATLAPLANCFDTWDKNPNPAKDTETHMAAWFAGAGFVLVMAKLVRLVAPSMRAGTVAQSKERLATRLFPFESLCPVPTGSPPILPLRI